MPAGRGAAARRALGAHRHHAAKPAVRRRRPAPQGAAVARRHRRRRASRRSSRRRSGVARARGGLASFAASSRTRAVGSPSATRSSARLSEAIEQAREEREHEAEGTRGAERRSAVAERPAAYVTCRRGAVRTRGGGGLCRGGARRRLAARRRQTAPPRDARDRTLAAASRGVASSGVPVERCTMSRWSASVSLRDAARVASATTWRSGWRRRSAALNEARRARSADPALDTLEAERDRLRARAARPSRRRARVSRSTSPRCGRRSRCTRRAPPGPEPAEPRRSRLSRRAAPARAAPSRSGGGGRRGVHRALRRPLPLVRARAPRRPRARAAVARLPSAARGSLAPARLDHRLRPQRARRRPRAASPRSLRHDRPTFRADRRRRRQRRRRRATSCGGSRARNRARHADHQRGAAARLHDRRQPRAARSRAATTSSCSTATRSSPPAGSSGSRVRRVRRADRDRRPALERRQPPVGPELRDEGAWAINPLPDWLTADGMALAVAGASSQRAPARSRSSTASATRSSAQVLDAVGYLDEEHFAEGYCEENDFCLRAREAGFELARRRRRLRLPREVAVLQPRAATRWPSATTQSSSRSTARRRVQPLVDQLEESTTPVLDLRPATRARPRRPGALRRSTRPRAGSGPAGESIFVLPGRRARRLGRVALDLSGGARACARSASPARIALAAKALAARARTPTPSTTEVFVRVRGDAPTSTSSTADADVLVATHFRLGARWSAALLAERHDFLAGVLRAGLRAVLLARGLGRASRRRAASYTAMPERRPVRQDALALQPGVGAAHGVHVATRSSRASTATLYRAADVERDRVRAGRRRGDGAARARRAASRAPRCGCSSGWRREFGDQVEIVTFGCTQEELERLTERPGLRDAPPRPAEPRRGRRAPARADVFLDLSIYQAFGRTALEAMACGCVPRRARGRRRVGVRGARTSTRSCATPRDEEAVHAAVTRARRGRRAPPRARRRRARHRGGLLDRARRALGVRAVRQRAAGEGPPRPDRAGRGPCRLDRAPTTGS